MFVKSCNLCDERSCREVLASCFLRWEVSVICPVIVLKLAVTVFTSPYFRTSWLNSVTFFSHFRNISVCDQKMTVRKPSLQANATMHYIYFNVCAPSVFWFCMFYIYLKFQQIMATQVDIFRYYKLISAFILIRVSLCVTVNLNMSFENQFTDDEIFYLWLMLTHRRQIWRNNGV